MAKVNKCQIQAQSQHPFSTKFPAIFLVSMNASHYPPFCQKASSHSVLQDGDSRASYYPVLERTIEHTKLSAKQNKEKIKQIRIT